MSSLDVTYAPLPDSPFAVKENFPTLRDICVNKGDGWVFLPIDIIPNSAYSVSSVIEKETDGTGHRLLKEGAINPEFLMKTPAIFDLSGRIPIVTGAVVYLAPNASNFVKGHILCLCVDGGYSVSA